MSWINAAETDMNRRTILSLCLVLVLPAVTSHAQLPGEDPNRVLLTVEEEETGLKGRYADLISKSLKIELERQGFTAVPAGEEQATSRAGTGESSQTIRSLPEKLKTEADSLNISHAAVCRYTVDETRNISLDYRLYDVTRNSLLSRVRERTEIDLTMDTVIVRSAERLIREAGIVAAERPKPLPAEDPGAETASAGETATVQLPPEPVESLPPQNGRNRFNLSVGFSPLLATGPSTQYFTLGIEPHINFGYRFRKPGNSFYLGFHTGLNRFIARGVLLQTENFVVPFGIDLRFLIDLGRVFNLYIGATGGPALFMIDSPVHGLLIKLIPFGMAGVGMDIQFSDHFGTAVKLNYVLYMEGSILLMGLSPAVNFFMRF